MRLQLYFCCSAASTLLWGSHIEIPFRLWKSILTECLPVKRGCQGLRNPLVFHDQTFLNKFTHCEAGRQHSLPSTFLKAGFILIVFMAENTGSHGLGSPASLYLHSYRQVGQLRQMGAWTYQLSAEMSLKCLPACTFIPPAWRCISISYLWVR